ncbi:hypothetical protein LguiA_031179 [Lonicera macranthoides]
MSLTGLRACPKIILLYQRPYLGPSWHRFPEWKWIGCHFDRQRALAQPALGPHFPSRGQDEYRAGIFLSEKKNGSHTPNNSNKTLRKQFGNKSRKRVSSGNWRSEEAAQIQAK